MSKLRRFLNQIAEFVRPRHFLETLEERATVRIAEQVIDDAAYVTTDIEDFWGFSASQVEKAGGTCFEFGVFEGTSINFFARSLGMDIHGFDSFEGLPSGGGVWQKYFDSSTFDRKGELPEVEDNVTLHKGWISDTLPAFIAANEIQSAAFIHIDTDVYPSAHTVLENLAPFIRPGTVIVFDELCNYKGYYLHEYQAFIRFLKKYGHDFEILAVCSVGTQYGNFLKVATRIR